MWHIVIQSLFKNWYALGLYKSDNYPGCSCNLRNYHNTNRSKIIIVIEILKINVLIYIFNKTNYLTESFRDQLLIHNYLTHNLFKLFQLSSI